MNFLNYYGYDNNYNCSPTGQYQKPSEWSPFDESHVNVPSDDRSEYDKGGKIVLNGECVDCVTDRPIIGPTKKYKKPSEWSPFDDSHANVPNGDRSGYGNTHTNNPSNWSPFDDSHANVPSQSKKLPKTASSSFGNLPRFGGIFSFTKERVKRANGNISPNPVKKSPETAKAPPTSQVSNKVFSGRLPDGTYVHNGLCNNCQIKN